MKTKDIANPTEIKASVPDEDNTTDRQRTNDLTERKHRNEIIECLYKGRQWEDLARVLLHNENLLESFACFANNGQERSDESSSQVQVATTASLFRESINGGVTVEFILSLFRLKSLCYLHVSDKHGRRHIDADAICSTLFPVPVHLSSEESKRTLVELILLATMVAPIPIRNEDQDARGAGMMQKGKVTDVENACELELRSVFDEMIIVDEEAEGQTQKKHSMGKSDLISTINEERITPKKVETSMNAQKELCASTEVPNSSHCNHEVEHETQPRDSLRVSSEPMFDDVSSVSNNVTQEIRTTWKEGKKPEPAETSCSEISNPSFVIVDTTCESGGSKMKDNACHSSKLTDEDTKVNQTKEQTYSGCIQEESQWLNGADATASLIKGGALLVKQRFEDLVPVVSKIMEEIGEFAKEESIQIEEDSQQPQQTDDDFAADASALMCTDSARRVSERILDTSNALACGIRDVGVNAVSSIEEMFEDGKLGRDLVPNKEERMVLLGVGKVAMAVLGSAAVLTESLIHTTGEIAQKGASVTADVVEHKYGENAGKIVLDASHTVGNSLKAVTTLTTLETGALTRSIAKQSGKHHLFHETNDKRKEEDEAAEEDNRTRNVSSASTN